MVPTKDQPVLGNLFWAAFFAWCGLYGYLAAVALLCLWGG